MNENENNFFLNTRQIMQSEKIMCRLQPSMALYFEYIVKVL